MPFKSPKQRKFMHMKHPDIAERWEKEMKAVHKPAVQPKKGRKAK